MTEIKIFDISTEKGLRLAERHQAMMYELYDNVKVSVCGPDLVRIEVLP